ncbi:YjdF family protein [Dactylosporangium sp. NPDC006015]|uniref:YjdF family protein n=1 Tax=Dactylosporangium sp. NPDC006015 TaxID=3154576 RepID=UPI0033B5FA0E
MATMTVFFDNPFWVAVLEVRDPEGVRATRHVFGGEPTDAELYQFLLRHGGALLDRAGRSAAVAGQPAQPPARSPKRLARDAAREAQAARPSTAAQEAVRKELELRKQASTQRGREAKEAHAEHRRDARRAKARDRHRGH